MSQDDATAKLRWAEEMQAKLRVTREPNEKSSTHELNEEPGVAIGVPYFRAVQGPDARYDWAQCPICQEVVKNSDGHGPARHWAANHA